MNGFIDADIMGVIGWSELESLEAAVSESLESLFEFELLFELPLFEFELPLFELLFELLDELPPPTRFWKNSCNLPHSTGLAGSRQAIRQKVQINTVAILMVLIGCLFDELLIMFNFFWLLIVILFSCAVCPNRLYILISDYLFEWSVRRLIALYLCCSCRA